jgi:DNA primase
MNLVERWFAELTEKQIRLLSRWTENFVLLFDGDAAGLKAAERALELFLPLGIIPKCVWLPTGDDPDSFVLRQGGEALKTLIQGANYLLDMMLEKIAANSRGSPEQAKGIERIGRWLEMLPSNVEKTIYIQRLADRFGLPEQVLWDGVLRRKDLSPQKSNFSTRSADAKQKALPPIEKALVELLLSGQIESLPLLQDIAPEEFSHPLLQVIWGLCRQQVAAKGDFQLATLVGEAEDQEARELITQLAMGGDNWRESGPQAVRDCLRQFRLLKMKGKLQRLSEDIRNAEGKQDLTQVRSLIEEKNLLLREMGTVH